MKNIVAVLFISVVLFACSSPGNQHPSAQYEEKKSSLGDMEKDSPPKFLKITGSHRFNLVSQSVVEGDITNKATLVTYKNIQVQIIFKDKEGAVVEKQNHTIDEEIKPGAVVDFKIKTGHVKGANSVILSVIDAEAEK